jgi:hypothetical protein
MFANNLLDPVCEPFVHLLLVCLGAVLVIVCIADPAPQTHETNRGMGNSPPLRRGTAAQT